jgi:signal peptidase I
MLKIRIRSRSLVPHNKTADTVSSFFAIVVATIVHTYLIQPFTNFLEKSLLVGDFYL